MSLTVSPTPQGTGACAPIFTSSWEQGAPDPVPGLCPWTKLRDFRLSDNLTPHHHRGPCPRQWVWDHRARGRTPTFTNSWARRTMWGKQETRHSVLLATKALAKMTNCTRRAIKLNNFLYNNKSGTLLAVGQQTTLAGGKRKLPTHSVLTFTLTDFLWTSVHPMASCVL